jgi:hypothetical protein
MPHQAPSDPQTPIAASRLRRPYHAPRLTELGAVAEVTHSTGTTAYTSDGPSFYAS